MAKSWRVIFKLSRDPLNGLNAGSVFIVSGMSVFSLVFDLLSSLLMVVGVCSACYIILFNGLGNQRDSINHGSGLLGALLGCEGLLF